MNFKLQAKATKNIPCLILPFFQDKNLEKQLKAMGDRYDFVSKNLAKDFQGTLGQAQMIYSNQGNQIHLIGLGKEVRFSKIKSTFQSWFFANKTKLATKLSIGLQSLEVADLSPIVEGIVQGAVIGRYDIGLYKTKKSNKEGFAAPKASLTFLHHAEDKKTISAAIHRSESIAKTQSQMLDLMNAPGNKAKPATLAAWAKKSGKTHGYKVQVFNKSQCQKHQLGALLAVNRGSEYPPAFIIMEYKPKSSGRKKLAKVGLLGKGVTFDTGGLSIKGATNMHYMKSDMGGAAAVLGAMEVCAKLQLPVHLIGIVPSTDNCVDALSVKPGDVINSYSGKTIEIIDTDAEGRLILADALAYMIKNFQPEIMIDLATLTGSSVRTLGYQAGALMTKNEKLSDQLRKAGQESGERLWPLPLWDEYFSDMESDVADIKNFSGKPLAGAITAGKFLEAFTSEHPAWAHLDIAGVAFGNSGLSKEKSATAYGIRLLITFLETLG